AALPVGSFTPRTSHRPSACGFVSEVHLIGGVSVDAALIAVIRIAAEPIVIADSRVSIGPGRRLEPIQSRRRGGTRHVALVVMMTGRNALGSRGHGEEGADREHQTSNVPHQVLSSALT